MTVSFGIASACFLPVFLILLWMFQLVLVKSCIFVTLRKFRVRCLAKKKKDYRFNNYMLQLTRHGRELAWPWATGIAFGAEARWFEALKYFSRQSLFSRQFLYVSLRYLQKLVGTFAYYLKGEHRLKSKSCSYDSRTLWGRWSACQIFFD